jgi:hypothetical protein
VVASAASGIGPGQSTAVVSVRRPEEKENTCMETNKTFLVS